MENYHVVDLVGEGSFGKVRWDAKRQPRPGSCMQPCGVGALVKSTRVPTYGTYIRPIQVYKGRRKCTGQITAMKFIAKVCELCPGCCMGRACHHHAGTQLCQRESKSGGFVNESCKDWGECSLMAPAHVDAWACMPPELMILVLVAVPSPTCMPAHATCSLSQLGNCTTTPVPYG